LKELEIKWRFMTMGVEVKWGDEAQTVLEYSFTDPWRWDDFYLCSDQARQMLADVDGTITVIIDLCKSRGLPPGAMTHFRRLGRDDPQRSRVILVGMNSFIRTFSNILMRFYPKAAEKVRFVATLDEAYAVIAERPRS
jgi:hypothetical protein